MIHRLPHLIGPSSDKTKDRGGRWVRATPSPWDFGLFDRLASAWAVLASKAYAVAWPEPGELEDALGLQPVREKGSDA